MTKEYTELTISHLNSEQCHAEYIYLPKIVHLEDPALEALIDFETNHPISFDLATPLHEARQAMEHSRNHIVLVFDHQQKLVGAISLEQLLSRKVIRLIEEFRVERKDMLLRHVMMPLEQIPAVNYDELEHAQIGHVVTTLTKENANYLLVYQKSVDHPKLRIKGVFLASELGRLLGKHLQIDANSFSTLADINKVHRD
jgi:Mg2+/Co2+ transporter CorB